METKASCADEVVVHGGGRMIEDIGTRNSRKNEPSERRRRKQSSEEVVKAMPNTIERTLS